MARLPYLDREQLPELERDIFDNLIAQRGPYAARPTAERTGHHDCRKIDRL